MFWGNWSLITYNLLAQPLFLRNPSFSRYLRKAYFAVDLVVIFEGQESDAISIYHINQAIFCINTP